MFLRILVNVGNHVPKLTVIRDGHAPERMFKQASSAGIGNIDTLCVGVEEVGKTLAWIIFKP